MPLFYSQIFLIVLILQIADILVDVRNPSSLSGSIRLELLGVVVLDSIKL